MKIKRMLVSVLVVLTVLGMAGVSVMAATMPTRHVQLEDGTYVYDQAEVEAWNQSLINENPNRVDQIRISGSGVMYDTDAETYTANVSMNPGGTSSGVTWSVSGPARIDQNGRLTPTGGAGTAVIEAKAKDPSVFNSIVSTNGPTGSGFLYGLTYKTAEYAVTIAANPKNPVKPAQPTVTGISLSRNNISFGHERDESWYPASIALTATLSPAGTDKMVHWYCGSPGVKVQSTGNNTCVVTPVSFLAATDPLIYITAECDNQVATCQVILISRNNNDIKVLLDKNRESIQAGGAFTLNAQVSGSNYNLAWSSSNPGVAKVDNNGNVTGVAPGQATITATATANASAQGLARAQAANSASATCQVTVTSAPAKEIAVTGVSLSPATFELEKGKQQFVKETVTPANATDRTITWGSSNSNVAKVDASGVVTAEGPGEAIITATSHNGVKGQAIVTVKENQYVSAPTKVSLSVNNKILEIGESVIIAANVEPAGTVQAVTWSSSNSDVAKVDQGKVTAHKAGKATITAKTPTGVSETCTITVNQPKEAVKNVSGVSLDTTSKTLKEGDSFILKETVSPSDATNKAVKWESSNPAAATVSAGKVTAVTKGTAQISVTTDDGNKTAKCTVNVQEVDTSKHLSVTGVKLNRSSASIQVGDSLPLDQTVTPADAADKDVKWFSTNDQVAKVSDQGIVVGVGAGEATITVVTEDGQKSDECKVTVKAIAEDTQHKPDSSTPSQPSNPGTDQPSNPQPDTPEQPGQPSDPGTDQPGTVEPSTPSQPSDSETPSTPTTEANAIYRLYLSGNNEHLFTTDANEAKTLVAAGWEDEGTGWNAPETGDPVYRLYSPVTKVHLYTKDVNEFKVLQTQGWTADNEGKPLFYSGGDKPVYRLYNEAAKRHHLTMDENEYKVLQTQGWKAEGIAFHSL